MYGITSYPYDLFATNEIQWVDDGQGIYFNGNARAATQKSCSSSPSNAISVQLLIKERFGSKNWGARYIFSLYEGPGNPSFVVGQRDGKIFVYSKYAENGDKKYFHAFRDSKRLPLNKLTLITATFGAKQQALYINENLANSQPIPERQSRALTFTGRYLLGNSPRGNRGWWGEIRGLAVYARVLSKDEIRTHSDLIQTSGITALADTDSLIALYPFDEGQGRVAQNVLKDGCSFYIPETRYSFAGTILNLPLIDIHRNVFVPVDFLMNIVFFIPLGALLYMILSIYIKRTLLCICLVGLAAACVSLSIEVIQLYLLSRVATIVDIVGNLAGAITGGILEVTRRNIARRLRSKGI
jgi:hypothetical protein